MQITVKQIVGMVLGVISLIFLIGFSGSLFESLDATHILAIQSPLKGEITWYTNPGLKYQGFGKIFKFEKRFQYWFSSQEDQGDDNHDAIKIRFNDGANAYISGSISCELPLDENYLTHILTQYGSQVALEQQLIRTVFEKSVYMTGPLMSSKESYAEKRNLLITYIEDQALGGVYKTYSYDIKEKDPITGVEKTKTLVEIVKNKTNGLSERIDISPLAPFGIKCYNLSINKVSYDKQVETQIEAQQKAIMDVQTAIAQAKQAEQKALTVAKEGEALAATEKWKQEAIKAQKVTEAEQKFEVAELDKKTADQERMANILRGEGEAKRRELIMAADSALEIKINALKEISRIYAEAIAQHKWVPDVMISNGTSQQGNQALDLMNLFTAKTLKDLGLDMTVPEKK